MSAIFIAMMLTGAGGLAHGQKPLPPVEAVPAPPLPPVSIPVPSPPPLRTAPAARPLPRGPSQPETGAARPELVRLPPFCRPDVPMGTRQIFARCFEEGDYPRAAYAARTQGNVGVRLAIDSEGRAESCEVTATSGSAELDRATCDMLRLRVRTAHIGHDGQPVSEIAGEVSWLLPTEPPRYTRSAYNRYFMTEDYPPTALRENAQGLVAFTNHVNADGRVTACEITRSSGWPMLDAATCRIIQSRARYYPARDTEGRQTPGVDTDGFIIWRLPEE